MLTGIDVSHFSSFTLQQLKSMVRDHRLYFNFLKASEGATLQDAKFMQYWQFSGLAGLLCGAYHFFRPLSNVTAQVNNFSTMYKKVSSIGALPPVVDIEWAKTAGGAEQWSQLVATSRVPAIMKFLDGVETQFNVKPMIYTAASFWQQFIAPNCTAQDNQTFAGYPLWLVDLRNSGVLPTPWKNTGATFIQTHFGEMATTDDPFDKLDQDKFPGSTKDLLNKTFAGLTIAKGAPFSFLVADIQTQLKALGMLQDAVDGIFGNNTETAVKGFQQANGLPVTGVVDAGTWNKLLL